MLHLAGKGTLDAWSTGATRLYVREGDDKNKPLLSVKCSLGGRHEVHAMLDTGSEWSVIDDDTAELLSDCIFELGDSTEIMNTRHGRIPGQFARLDLTLLAARGQGNDLQMETTVLVLKGWPGPITLGFRGCLEHIRFALDSDDRAPLFYFGLRA